MGEFRVKTSAPPELPPEQMGQLRVWCHSKMPSLLPRLDDLVERCLDWHRAEGRKRVDWVATCRNWLRKERDFVDAQFNL